MQLHLDRRVASALLLLFSRVSSLSLKDSRDAQLFAVEEDAQLSTTQHEDVKFCVKQYARSLHGVKPGLGAFIRDHPLKTKSTSNKPVIIGAGSGNTGTHSVYNALKSLKLEAWHAAKSKTWDARRAEIKNILHYKVAKHEGHQQKRHECEKKLRSFDYVQLLNGTDAVVDMPTAEVFLNLFLSFPKAKVILSTRPPRSWVEGRMRTHPSVSPPIQEPCGLQLQDFTAQELARLYSLNNAFVRCLVPKQQLLEFDLWTDSDTRMSGLMRELAEFVGLQALAAPLPHVVPGAIPAAVDAATAAAPKVTSYLPVAIAAAQATLNPPPATKESCMAWLDDHVKNTSTVDFGQFRQAMTGACDMDSSAS